MNESQSDRCYCGKGTRYVCADHPHVSVCMWCDCWACIEPQKPESPVPGAIAGAEAAKGG